MQKAILSILSWLAAHLPEVLLEALAAVLGWLIWVLPSSRHRVIRSNLYHALPGVGEARREAIGLASCQRAVENALLALAFPRLSQKRLQRMFRLDPSAAATLPAGQGAVVLIPHLDHIEAFGYFSPLWPDKERRIACLYRPFDNAALDALVRSGRARLGSELLSRKRGLVEGRSVITEGGLLGLLFDQNAGDNGCLSLLFDRVCSTSDLPELYCQRQGARAVVAYAKRETFWRSRICCEALPSGEQSVTYEANRWLERFLRASDDQASGWLWLHDRWRNQDRPEARLQLKQNRQELPSSLPRRLDCFVRMPNWLGDVVMALPLLRAMEASRPDLRLHLLARPHLLPLLERLCPETRRIGLDGRGLAYFAECRRLAGEYPHLQINFTNSSRGDLESWLIGAPQRFGMLRPGKSRPLLTHHWTVPPEIDERQLHQCEVWEQFLQHFGLAAPMNRTPRTRPQPATPPRIGYICGTENAPEKRWPIPHWIELITKLSEQFPEHRHVLFGTSRDRPITSAIASACQRLPVEDLAGRTSLDGFLDELGRCELLIGNDTGGIHLANALGIPVLVLFGPTNPIRTGPIFEAPVQILQPPNCPPTGGLPMDQLAVDTVCQIAGKQLQKTSS